MFDTFSLLVVEKIGKGAIKPSAQKQKKLLNIARKIKRIWYLYQRTNKGAHYKCKERQRNN